MLNRILGRYNKAQYRQHEDFLYKGSASAITQIDFVFTQKMLDNYRAIRIAFSNLRSSNPAGINLNIRMSADFGSSFAATAGDYEMIYSYVGLIGTWVGASNIVDTAGYGPICAQDERAHFDMLVLTAGSTGRTIIHQRGYGPYYFYIWQMVRRKTSNTQCNAVRFIASSDNASFDYVVTGVD